MGHLKLFLYKVPTSIGRGVGVHDPPPSPRPHKLHCGSRQIRVFIQILIRFVCWVGSVSPSFLSIPGSKTVRLLRACCRNRRRTPPWVYSSRRCSACSPSPLVSSTQIQGDSEVGANSLTALDNIKQEIWTSTQSNCIIAYLKIFLLKYYQETLRKRKK